MSLILNNFLNKNLGPVDDSPGENNAELASLDRYLEVIENNRKASFFVPNDALVALDMAGYALGRLHPEKGMPSVSAVRLALALVQPCNPAPVQ